MDTFKIIKTIGEGAYGIVYKAKEKKTSETVAIKQFKSENDEDLAKRELQVCSMLSHPNVVAFRGSFRSQGLLCLVFDFVPRTLLQLLDQNRNGIHPEKARQLVYQLCKAVQCCHANSIIHRDIKPENILLEADDTVKLCDFGVATQIRYEGTPLTDYVATRWYRPPEQELRCTDYSFNADIWSIGCIMIELLSGAPAFSGESQVDQLYQVQQLLGPLPAKLAARLPAGVTTQPASTSLQDKYGERVSKLELQFIQGAIEYDPAKRMSAMQCLQHKYFEDLRTVDETERKDRLESQSDCCIIEEELDGCACGSDDEHATAQLTKTTTTKARDGGRGKLHTQQSSVIDKNDDDDDDDDEEEEEEIYDEIHESFDSIKPSSVLRQSIDTDNYEDDFEEYELAGGASIES